MDDTSGRDEPRHRVREMTEPDIDAVAAVRVSGWRYAYAGLMPQSYLDGLSAAEYAGQRRAAFADPANAVTNLVAEGPDGAVLGWAAFGPAQGTDPEGAAPDEGELYALYARPDVIGTGVGRALLTEVLRRAAYPAVRLWVVEGNDRARRFYERAGFRPDGGVLVDETDGFPVHEVGYRRTAAG
ncbi:GNAT family N-acetyltransferase [Streptomyces sp. NBC_00335]|uniref:GNAT family N-acetyltransferase n=1 Tax=unclassified Streptomyces TaxID=2593676 RepID=UPI002252C19F|nr:MULTISPECIES: N-acetyltransferase [unclassified Streptomyces]MCX5405832.1 GNAT family N-acetyltransferase [Streptomyces sp. NBC_00086]